MPMTFPIKQEHVANLKPKGRRSKHYGGLKTPAPPRRTRKLQPSAIAICPHPQHARTADCPYSQRTRAQTFSKRKKGNG